MMGGLVPMLALRDLRHDWLGGLCFIAALMAVLFPVLILLALKNGVIDQMVDRLFLDPANRELIVLGAGQHDDAFFERLAAREDIAFVTPTTRSINALANGLQNPGARVLERDVPLIVSAPGDPLIDGAPVAPGRVWLSASLADKLQAAAGDELRLNIGRSIDHARQNASAQITVIGVLPAETYGRDALFLSLPDMVAIERFRDDSAITPETWRDPAPEPRHYASFRAYARDLSDLAPLKAWLEDQSIRVQPRAANAPVLMALRDKLSRLFQGIAVLALAGAGASMAANLRGLVERRRVALSLLRLGGMPVWKMQMIPVIQGVVLVGLGVAATFVALIPVLMLVNHVFAGTQAMPVALLPGAQISATFAVALLGAVVSALWAVLAIARIPASEVLHHG